MTKKTTDALSSDLTDLRALLAEMHTAFATTIQNTIQTSMQTSIQRLGESLTTRLDTMNTILTRLDPQNQQVVNVQQHPPIQPLQRQHQQQLPPIHHPRPNQQRRQQLNPVGDARDHHEGNTEDEEDELHRRVYRDDLRQRDHLDNRWENGFRVNIPEFHGGLKGDDLIDWLVAVEKILEFKQVPPPRRVPLVAMRFRGHAAT